MSNHTICEDFDLLVDIVGKDKALKIVETFQGTTLYFPKRYSRKSQHSNIRAQYKEGMSIVALAIAYGYTPAYIRRIITKRK